MSERSTLTRQSSVLPGVIVMSAMVIAAAIAWSAAPDPISWDGVAYAQSTENFASGRGLVITPNAPSESGDRLIPLQMFPPGFPIASAIFAWFGMSGFEATLLVTRLSWVVLPLCAFVVFRIILGSALPSAILAALISFAPGVIESGLNVHSDVLFLDVVLISAALLVHGFQSSRMWPVIVSGLLAGIAYTIRNAGLAYFAAGAALFLAAALGQPWTIRAAIQRIDWRMLVLWLVSALPGVGLVKARALIVFGALEPYSMPPSTMGLVENLRWMAFSVVSDVTSVRSIAWLMWNKWLFVATVLLVAVAGVLVFLYMVRRTSGKDTTTGPVVVMLAAYIVVGQAMLVIARTKYDWQAIIDERYATQYTWALAALAGLVLLSKAQPSRMARALLVVCVLLAGARVVSLTRLYTDPFEPVLTKAEEATAITAIERLPVDVVIVSNEAAALTLATGRDVRQLGRRGAPEPDLLAELSQVAPARPEQMFVGAFVSSGPAADARKGWRVISAADRFVLVSKSQNPDLLVQR